MTLNYQDKVPPVGVVDHIDYAIKRTNLPVRRTMLLDLPQTEGPVTTMAEDDEITLRIVEARSVGPLLYLTVKRPVNPYLPEEEVDEDDPKQWVNVRREHRRFSVQEVLKDFLPDGLAVNARTDEAYIEALGLAGIGVTADTVSFEVMGNTLTVTSTEKNSLMWWGQGHVELTAHAVEVA